MKITVYRGARNPKPVEGNNTFTWPELCDELEVLANEPSAAPAGADPEEQKKRLLAWSPHVLEEGTTRAAENVRRVTAMVLDVDNSPPKGTADPPPPVKPETIVKRLAKQGLAGFVYESPSATPSNPRFRVVVPVRKSFAPEHSRAARLAFAEALGLRPGSGVEGAVEAAKLFFVGRLHDSPERRTWRVDGAPLDVAALPAPALAWGKGKGAAVATELAELPPADAGIVAAIGDWRLHNSRKWDLCGAVGGAMRQAGYTRKQCAAVIQEWLPADEPGVDAPAGVAWALGAWAKGPEEVSGTDALEGLLGAKHGALLADVIHEQSWWGQAAAKRKAARAADAGFVAGEGGDDATLGEALSWTDPDEPVDYYCEGLRLAPSRGKISLIGGLPGAGKGPLANALALSFALGVPFAGKFSCRKSRVLLLDVEGARLTKRRIARMARAIGRKPRELVGALDLRDVSGCEIVSIAFLEAIEATMPEVVIVDSYTTAMLSTDVDSNKPEFARLARGLARVGCLVLAVAHGRKPSGERGSYRPTLADIAGNGALGAMAQTAISVWREDENAPERVRVGCMRAPETAFAPFDVVFTDTHDGAGLLLAVEDSAAQAKASEEAEGERRELMAGRLLSFLHKHPAQPFTAKALRAAGVRTDRPEGEELLAALLRAEILFFEPDVSGRSGGRYTLAGDAPEAVTFDDAGEVVA